MDSTSNKTIIARFYREIVRERKSELIPQYIHENYIQHSPMGKDGQQGLVEMVTFLNNLTPVPENEPSPIKHLIEQNDMVVAHLELNFMGKQISVIEIFRLQDGKAAEHWDVTEERTDATSPLIIVSIGCVVIDRMNFLKNLYKQSGIVIHRIISEDDLTAIHAEAKGDAAPIALLDIYQFEADKLTGHWSVKQPVPNTMPHNNGMF